MNQTKYIFSLLLLCAFFQQKTTAATSFISSYIRNSFYETGAVDSSKILHSDDIILLNTSIYKDGRLFFELPDNRGAVRAGGYLQSYQSRDGVLSLYGAGSQMDVGEDLLVRNGHAAVSGFTFGTWLYLEKWREEAYLFVKEGENKEVSLRFSAASEQGLIFKIKDGAQVEEVFFNVTLSRGRWQHIALIYDGNANGSPVSLIVDGKTISAKSRQNEQLKLPFMQGRFIVGKGLEAKLDNTYLNHTVLSGADQKAHSNGIIDLSKWSHTKTVAFWNYDMANELGKDLRSWKNILADIRRTIDQKNITVRLGLIGGDWKIALSNDESLNRFVHELRTCVQENSLDGVDFDLEWCVNENEWNFYSNAILSCRKLLGAEYLISASLHPLYYQISRDAIAALDFISLQAYGPSPVRFGYDTFAQEINQLIQYGVPPEKVVMGLPFYGVALDNRRPLVAKGYRDILHASPDLSPASDTTSLFVHDEVIPLIFNGLKTIKKKVELVREYHLKGVMSWDLATDVDFDHPKSLFRQVVSIIKDKGDVRQ